MGPLPKPLQLLTKLLNLLGIFLTCTLLACGGGSLGGGLGSGVGGGAGAGGALDGSGTGGGGTQNTPLDHDAVGPMTDYNLYIQFLDCQPIKCIPNITVNSEGQVTYGGPDQDGCTQTLVFSVQAFFDGEPATGRVVRVVERGLEHYKDYVPDGEGKMTIEIPTDTSPWVDFWLHPAEANPADVNPAADYQNYTDLTAIVPEPPFQYLRKQFMGGTCYFINNQNTLNLDAIKNKFPLVKP